MNTNPICSWIRWKIYCSLIFEYGIHTHSTKFKRYQIIYKRQFSIWHKPPASQNSPKGYDWYQFLLKTSGGSLGTYDLLRKFIYIYELNFFSTQIVTMCFVDHFITNIELPHSVKIFIELWYHNLFNSPPVLDILAVSRLLLVKTMLQWLSLYIFHCPHVQIPVKIIIGNENDVPRSMHIFYFNGC